MGNEVPCEARFVRATRDRDPQNCMTLSESAKARVCAHMLGLIFLAYPGSRACHLLSDNRTILVIGIARQFLRVAYLTISKNVPSFSVRTLYSPKLHARNAGSCFKKCEDLRKSSFLKVRTKDQSPWISNVSVVTRKLSKIPKNPHLYFFGLSLFRFRANPEHAIPSIRFRCLRSGHGPPHPARMRQG
jgi:hypothetical protein